MKKAVMIKAAMMFALFLLFSSSLAFAQEEKYLVLFDNDSESAIDSGTAAAAAEQDVCGISCEIWQFLFGSKEARAGRAWWDRSEPKEALAGEAASPEEAKTNAAALKTEADDLYAAGEYAVALNKISGAIKLNSQDYTYYNLKGIILQELERHDEAIDSFDFALRFKEVPPEVRKTIQDTKVDSISQILKIPETNQRLKAAGVEGTLKDVPGTFTLDENGQELSFQKKGSEKKSSVDISQLAEVRLRAGQQLQQFHTVQSQQVLGQGLFNQYQGAGFIDYSKTTQISTPQGDVITYALTNNLGTITAVTDAQGYVTITGNVMSAGPQGQSPTSWQVLRKDGQTIASQTAQQREEGVMTVGFEGRQETIVVGKGVIPSQLKNGAVVYSSDKNSAVQFAQNQLVVTDFEKETQTIFDTQTKEQREYSGGDLYAKGDGSCAQEKCFVPTSGTATLIDAQGKQQTYLVDLSYEQDGDERVGKTPEAEFRNSRTGRLEGIQTSDKTQIFAQRDEKGDYNSKYGVTTSKGTVIVEEKSDGAFVLSDTERTKLAAAQTTVTEAVFRLTEAQGLPMDTEGREKTIQEAASNLEQAKKEKDKITAAQDEALNEVKEHQESLDEVKEGTTGSLAAAQTVMESIYSITNSIKSYPAISQLLFGDAEFYKDWQRATDVVFAPMIGENFFPSAICENDDLHWREIESAGKKVIKTPSGTFQAVASIQMERSAETSFILCHRNPDEEAEEQFICERRQVCIDDSFCYADKDRDEEPDEDKPLKGYFYKVTWAVSAPKDEVLTPLLDENGVAVSFNIVLRPGNVSMYSLGGNTVSPIQLTNGESDKDTIIKFSPKLYDEACIVWNKAPMSAGMVGGFDEIGDVCYGITDDGFISSVGQVNWERSGKEAESITHDKGEISRNTDW